MRKPPLLYWAVICISIVSFLCILAGEFRSPLLRDIDKSVDTIDISELSQINNKTNINNNNNNNNNSHNKTQIIHEEEEKEEENAYSSLYCVAHAFTDPILYSSKSKNINNNNNNNNNNSELRRVDVILNGVWLPDLLNNTGIAENKISGSHDTYYFPIYNRTCLYSFVYFNKERNAFYFYMQNNSKNRELLKKKKLKLPPVSLSSRAIELPRVRASVLRRQAHWAFEYSPHIILGKKPRNILLLNQQQQQEYYNNNNNNNNNNKEKDKLLFVPYYDILVGYFLPTVAPWNFAHTLLCDLFGFFWGQIELQHAFANIFPIEMHFLSQQLSNIQFVATSFRYFPKYPLPNSNKAFSFMSHRPALYDIALSSGIYKGLLAGTGTKSWSWITKEYKASGSPALWFAFRHYIINHTGAQQPLINNNNKNNVTRPLRVSICYKEDKRGITNTKELIEVLTNKFSKDLNVEFILETIVGHSAKEQVEMMLANDIFICNEGTLSTIFFLMNPGSIFLAIPLIYHSPHLHIMQMPAAELWWKLPDIMRVDPRYNTGGNIDWFPPVIPWIRVAWFSEISLSEVIIQQPLRGLRNFMPDYNIIINPERFAELVYRAIIFIRHQGILWDIKYNIITNSYNFNNSSYNNVLNNKSQSISVAEKYQYIFTKIEPYNYTNILHNSSQRSIFYLHETNIEYNRFIGRIHRPPNYSITADQCRRLLYLRPILSVSFNSPMCHYGMSWLCEFYINTRFSHRIFHDKWRNSKKWCGNEESWPEYWRRNSDKLHSVIQEKINNNNNNNNSEREFYDLNKSEDYFFDIREQWNLSKFLFFNKEDLYKSYNMTDLRETFRVEEDVVRKLFG